MARSSPLYDHLRSKRAREERVADKGDMSERDFPKGKFSEPVEPDELIEDAGDMSVRPDSPPEKLRRLRERKKKD